MTAHLNTLIRLRQHDVDQRQVQLAQLTNRAQEARQSLAEIDQRIVTHKAELSGPLSNGRVKIDTLQLRQNYLRLLIADRSERQQAVDIAALDAAQQRARLVAADQQLKIAEQLQARALLKVRQQVSRQESLEIDEAWQAKRRSIPS